MTYACEDQAAGSDFTVGVDSLTRVSGTVRGTGGWTAFQDHRLGRLRLESGRHTLAVRAVTMPRGAVMNLRAVRLTPVPVSRPAAQEPAPPRISVVTPSFNQAPFLQRAISSVLDQHYPNLEYVVVDGGSGDGSLAIIQQWAGHLSRWVCEPDGGQADAINKGLRWTTGELVAWLNADDFFLPGAL